MSVTVRQIPYAKPFKQRDNYTWDDDEGEYIDEDGKPVDKKKILLLVLLLMQFGRAAARTASESLIAGDITIDEWADQMSTMIRSMTISMGVLAYGGVANLTPERLAAIESMISEQQTQYLDKFVAGLKSADIEIGPAIISRSEMYALPGWPAYAKLERQREIADGAQWERRVLDSPINGCSECEEEADRGWQPMGELPDIGTLECSVGCKCNFEYSDSATMPSGDTGEDNL